MLETKNWTLNSTPNLLLLGEKRKVTGRHHTDLGSGVVEGPLDIHIMPVNFQSLIRIHQLTAYSHLQNTSTPLKTFN